MNKLVAISLAALTAGVLPGFVTADHGTDVDGRPCATDVDAIDVAGIYIDLDLYVYQESNNMAGLQHGSESAAASDPIFGPDVVDCSHPDTILF